MEPRKAKAVQIANNGMEATQELLFRGIARKLSDFPATRYQGSKRKLLPWIWEQIQHLEFSTCLDVFSGTSSVAYLLKLQGKTVTTNDYLRCNAAIARALIVNSETTFPDADADDLLSSAENPGSETFIQDTFSGIFFTDAENRWLDAITPRIAELPDTSQRDLAHFALFQSCLAKRPYNLFHRANLYMRTAEVERSFGNKATWDRPFKDHFRAALQQANSAVFDNGKCHRALCGDFLALAEDFDLVYLDPPYLNARGTSVDYLDFYHFLEGLTEYEQWPLSITDQYKHKPYKRRGNPWNDPKRILGAFDDCLAKFRDSIIVISYRSNGIPGIDDIVALLGRHGRRDARKSATNYKYVLSPTSGKEVLLVSSP